MATLHEEISRRRTFAIISHPDAGKTTLTEKFLLYGGAIAQAGEVKGKRARAATSDWMEIEKQRGISVTSSVMQFQHGGYCINILDTPGHQDFSEDTYRTLMAADSAVMVIDGAKGVEPQTRKLFRVCALRHIPIFTFINKMDRETRDPLELCEEVERELGIDTYAVNWPIGCGKEFQGVYDREKQCIIHFTDAGHAKKAGVTEIALDDPALVELIGQKRRDNLADEIELLGALEHRRWLQFHYDLGWRYGTEWNGDKALRERMRCHNDLIEGYDSTAHPRVSEAEGLAHYRLALDEAERLKDKEPLRYMLRMLHYMDGVRFYRIRSTEEEAH